METGEELFRVLFGSEEGGARVGRGRGGEGEDDLVEDAVVAVYADVGSGGVG